MRKEQLQNIFSYLESIKEKDGDYKKYIDSLDLLVSRLLDYYTPNIQGKYMDMTKEEYDEIDKLFKDSTEKSNFFLNTDFADEKNEIARDVKKTVAQKIHQDILTDFYNEFKNVKLEEGKSFFETIQKGKPVEVESDRKVGDISMSAIYTDGLFKKDKMTVTYGNEKVSGTFIYKAEYDPEKEVDKLIKEFSVKYPEYKDYFVSLNEINKLNELSAIDNSDIVDKNGKVINFFNGKELLVSEIDNFNNFKNELNFLNANAEFILKLRPVLKEINDYSINLKAKNNTVLDRRNVAVTNVAKMLNNEGVIPNARAVAIESNQNGEKTYVEGTFIEDAKGKTINEFALSDPVHTSGIDAWDTVEAKKALANLQIIDYICGTKRDINNIKFEFDPKTNKLIGVEGINNEKSFFTPNIKPEIIGEEDYSGLENIKVIDSDMAMRIEALSEAEFKASMIQAGLNETEAHEAWRRVENLQEVIKNPKILDEKDNSMKLFKEEKLLIVNGDEAWNNLKLNELKANGNIFEKVLDAQKTLTSEAKVDKSLDDNYKILKFSYNNKLDGGDKFLDEARRNAPLFGTSKRYSNIIKGLSEYNNAITSEDKAKKLDGLKALVDAYNAEKISSGVIDKDGNLLKNLTGKDLGRVNLVSNLDNFIKNTKALGNEVKEAFDKKNNDEKKVDEFNATYRLGKYKNYAKVYKNENNQILINANILEREKQNNNILIETVKEMRNINNGVDLDKSPTLKAKYDLCKNYIDTTIKNCKEQLLSDYHHGAIPKEYFDYKNEKYDKKIFDFDDEENKFAYENPESKIFKNDFQEQISNKIEKELGEDENMIEMEDFSNKQELEIDEKEIQIDNQ